MGITGNISSGVGCAIVAVMVGDFVMDEAVSIVGDSGEDPIDTVLTGYSVEVGAIGGELVGINPPGNTQARVASAMIRQTFTQRKFLEGE